MRKVLFNKLTKLIIFVLVLIIAGVAIYSGFTILEKNIEYSNNYYKINDERDSSAAFNDSLMRNVVAKHLNGVLGALRSEGMEGVRDYYNMQYDKNRYDEFHVIIANDTGIFSSFSDVDASAITEDREEFVRYYFWSNEDRFSEMTIFPTRRLMVNNGYTWVEYRVEDILSEEIVAYLKDIDYNLSLRICATFDGFVEYDKTWNDYYDVELERLMNNLESELKPVIKDTIQLLVALTVLLIVSIIVCGKTKEGKKELNRYERTFTEIHIAIIGLAIGGAVLGIHEMLQNYNDVISEYKGFVKYAFVCGILMAFAIIYYEIGIIIKKMLNGRVIKDSIIYKICVRVKKSVKKLFSKIKNMLYNTYSSSFYAGYSPVKKLYIKKVLMDILVIGLIIGFVVYLWTNYGVYVYIVPTIILGIVFVFYAALSGCEYVHLREYVKVARNIKNIYEGNFSMVEAAKEKDGELLKQVANLSDGFKASVAKQVEAEKMQVELVANVSHDLKTPLTSIISYVDLLSKEELSPVTRDYVKILEEKSARLKGIVADVFDLAKATSGEKIDMEQLDGVVLINQVLSDMNDKITEAGRDFRVRISPETATVTGNGQKLYRVFQNIIDNALKYSMPGTRIYLIAESYGGEFVVKIKNVSEFEMEFTKEEILSRFTRGDKARHSEGNGLGLSIAKSFTELCGGAFDINIDDDVFEVIIRLR